MDIYLDANATTPVLPQAQAAAMAAMGDNFGNPSSIHGTGLKARALLDGVRASARRILGAPTGQLTFTSGATEGIQTAVLSALTSLRARADAGKRIPPLLLYGSTEHKAVPVALQHWNRILGLNSEIRPIPVGPDGRHDLDWLRSNAAQAGLVCTMAANNETGVISDLDGIERALMGSGALWLVDCVQALGKLQLALGQYSIDYAPFSGHKLCAPKGIGLLYVRSGAPFTPLMTGGGQEGDLRSGTENMAGIAALGAVLKALEEGESFKSRDVLSAFRGELVSAVVEAFPGVLFNAPAELCLPTTLNFGVPGVSAKVLLDLFDAAGVRVSGGSACSASKGKPSEVLLAMGLPAWRAENAVRMSFGAVEDQEMIAEACSRIQSCGEALRGSCLVGTTFDARDAADISPLKLLTRFAVDGACCYLVSPPNTNLCVVIDPLPELSDSLAKLINCQGRTLAAVLDTHSHGDHASSSAALWAATENAPARFSDDLGWPIGKAEIVMGDCRVTRLATPGHTIDAQALLLHSASSLVAVFVGDTVMPGALGRSDFEQSSPESFSRTLRHLAAEVGRDTLLLPGHDYEDRHATTLNIEYAAQPLVAAALDSSVDDVVFARAKADLERDLAPTEYRTMACGARVDCCAKVVDVELSSNRLDALLAKSPLACLVDVRETYEQCVDDDPAFPAESTLAVPLSVAVNSIPDWLQLPHDQPLVFFCRSGNRSAEVARALRRLGRNNAWSLAGGLALYETARAAEPAVHR